MLKNTSASKWFVSSKLENVTDCHTSEVCERTTVGKNRLVRNILNAMATVKVPRNRMKDSRKTSGTACVMLSSLQALPVRFHPRSRHWSSETHPWLTSTRSPLDRQFESNSDTHSTLLTSTCRRFFQSRCCNLHRHKRQPWGMGDASPTFTVGDGYITIPQYGWLTGQPTRLQNAFF